MEKIVVSGGRRLSGTVSISGAKNSVLKIMAAAILTDEPVILRNVPDISDVQIMVEVLRELGVVVSLSTDGVMRIEAGSGLKSKTPFHLVSKMRASVIVLGPLLARLGEAQVAMPGGCNIGSRKIDLHIRGLELMGAEIEPCQGYIEAKTARLTGAEIMLEFPSVGATENILMAAVLAVGTTVIGNAAREPEIIDLAGCLSAMGADITGAGTSYITIRGVPRLHGVDYTVVSDRIEAGTFMVAGAITGGDIFLSGARAEYLGLVIDKLREIGLIINIFPEGIEVKSTGRLSAVNIATLPYCGFPTDLQAPFMALLSLAKGTSIITENVFENRFIYVKELQRLGSKVSIEAHHAIVDGSDRLSGAKVKAPDLRGGAALTVAGLAAEGVTEISDIYHIERGYENFEDKLRMLGARIERQGAETEVLLRNPDNSDRTNLSPAH